jgi:sodium-dependent dicarboxylate transporter 2/3/5
MGAGAESRGRLAWKAGGIAAALIVFALICGTDSRLHHIDGYGSRPAYAAATAALMVVLWFTEAIPIAWTALAPLLLYPLLGVYGKGPAGDAAEAADGFLDAYLFMFMGGMMIGAAMEQWNLHRRVALHIMRRIGSEPKRLLLGVIVSTSLISLWISNTATAVMMLPIAAALLGQLERAGGGGKLWSFGSAVMLAVAYGCNVGGIGTKIGTGTNSIFCGFVDRELHYDISFLRYLALGLPFVVLMIPLLWSALWRLGAEDAPASGQGREILDAELAAMGPMSLGERKVAAVFLLAAFFWIAGDLFKPGLKAWSESAFEGFRFAGKHWEALVALAGAALLLAVGGLSPRKAVSIPWSALVLLGGSFSMASGIEGSGLATWMARELKALADLPLFVQVGLAGAATVFLSAVASNTATATVMLKVLLTALVPGVPPEGLAPELRGRTLAVLSATAIGSSCDFMLPAGTPPNAIVFGSGYIRLPVMMRTGFLLDVASVLLIAVYAWSWGRWIFS